MRMGNKYVHEAYSAIFQQDYNRATEAFLKAIRLHPKEHSLFYKLSITYARNNELGKALEAIREALRLDEHNEGYLLHLQHLEIRSLAYAAKEALRENREVTSFIQPIQEYIKIDPLQLELKWILGLIFYSLSDYTKADEQMSEILTIAPNHQHAIEYFKNRSEENKDVH